MIRHRMRSILPNTTLNGGGLGPQFATFALSLNRCCQLTARIDGINRAFLFRNAQRAGSAQTHPHEQRSTNSRSSSAVRIPITDRHALDRQRSSLPPPHEFMGGRSTSTSWGTFRDGHYRRLPHPSLPCHEFMGGLVNQHLLGHL